ncbi:unnamed protein product [Haemonchus placei]|uniref:Uncharacterized protein n=1 Tax=Haemonchus placei TaxID=6290 RepID=A0A0N4WFR3_HAEPC|nr:unnamed protein product [Haemonchus placei]
MMRSLEFSLTFSFRSSSIPSNGALAYCLKAATVSGSIPIPLFQN